MNLNYETKLRKNSNSIITTIPKNIVDLLDLKEGNKIIWKVNIENGIYITIKPSYEDEKHENIN